MSKFKRKREDKTQSVEAFEDKFGYAEMEERMTELAEKSGWEVTDEESDFDMYCDAVIEMARIDDLDSADAEAVTEVYEELKEKSGLSNIEIEEFETFVKRLARYDALISPIQDIAVQILKGELDENENLGEDLNKAIQGFGQKVANDMAQFQENWRLLAAQFEENKDEFMSDLQKAADIAKKGATLSEKLTAIDLGERAKEWGVKVARGGLDAGKGAWNLAKSAKDLIPFVGKNKKKFNPNDKFEEEFQEVYEIMEAFPHLDRDLNDMQKLMKKVVEKNLDPIRKNALIIGREQVVVIKRYSEYIEAAKELERVFEEKFLPMAEENAAKGGNYQLGMKYINDALGALSTRRLQLQSSQTQANAMTTNLEMMQDTVKNFISRARYYEQTAVPEFKMAMDTIRESMDLMKVAQKMADFENLGAKIYGAMAAVAKVTQSIDQKMSGAAVDPEALAKLSEEMAQLSVDRAAHKQLEHQRTKQQAKLLENASKQIDEAKKEVGKRLLTDASEVKEEKPSASDSFKKIAQSKQGEKQGQKASEEAADAQAAAARQEKLEKLKARKNGATNSGPK